MTYSTGNHSLHNVFNSFMSSGFRNRSFISLCTSIFFLSFLRKFPWSGTVAEFVVAFDMSEFRASWASCKLMLLLEVAAPFKLWLALLLLVKPFSLLFDDSKYLGWWFIKRSMLIRLLWLSAKAALDWGGRKMCNSIFF